MFNLFYWNIFMVCTVVQTQKKHMTSFVKLLWSHFSSNYSAA